MDKYEFESRRRKVSIAIHNVEDSLQSTRRHLNNIKNQNNKKQEYISSFVSPIRSKQQQQHSNNKKYPRQFSSPEYAFKLKNFNKSNTTYNSFNNNIKKNQIVKKVQEQEINKTSTKRNKNDNHYYHLNGSLEFKNGLFKSKQIDNLREKGLYIYIYIYILLIKY